MTGHMISGSTAMRKRRYAATGSMRMLDEAGNEYLVTKYNVFVEAEGREGMVWENCETQFRTATGTRVDLDNGHYTLREANGVILIPKPGIDPT